MKEDLLPLSAILTTMFFSFSLGGETFTSSFIIIKPAANYYHLHYVAKLIEKTKGATSLFKCSAGSSSVGMFPLHQVLLWVTGALQGTCIYLCLPFYQAPRRKYKPHMAKILPIASSWINFCVIGETSLPHTHCQSVQLWMSACLISLLCNCYTLLPIPCWTKKASDTLF